MPPKPSKAKFKMSWRMSVTAGVLVALVLSLLGGFGAFLGLAGFVCLATAIYALVTGRKSWAVIPSRKVAAFLTIAGLVVMTAGIAISPRAVRDNVANVSTTVDGKTTSTSSPHASSIAAFTEEAPIDPDVVTEPTMEPAVAVASSTVTDAYALALLNTLLLKDKASKADYDRTGDFGTAWMDVDRNGCDTRNDILARDLINETLSGACRVMSGELVDPYTASTIQFVRGVKTSALVQIDHVVALANAWQTGAQQLTQAQRISLANDPLNLLAVDGSSNVQKSDKDASAWLPSNLSYRCPYVSRQVSVKATYGLWVTQAEYEAMHAVLTNCPNERASTSTFAPLPPAPPPTVQSQPTPVQSVAPKPATPTPAPAPPAAPKAPAIVHAGSFCSVAGSTGVTSTGKAMVCKTSATDSRLRWRAA